MFHLTYIIIYYVALKSTETFIIQKDNTTQQRQTYMTHITLQQKQQQKTETASLHNKTRYYDDTITSDHIFARGQKFRQNGGVLRARDNGLMARITTHTNIVTDLGTQTKYFMTTLLYK